MAINVALVSADFEVRSSFQAVVAEASGVELIGALESGRDLLNFVEERPDVDVVVVDAGLSDQPVNEVIRDLALSAPTIAALGISDQPTALATMVTAGARGLLTMPLSLQDVQTQLDAAAAWSRALREHLGGDVFGGLRAERGHVITVAGAKGGVGCSTLATAVAVRASRAGQSTCLVDLDLRSGNLAFFCGVSPRRTVADLAELVGDLTIRGIREVAVQVPAGFILIAAPDEVERAEDVSPAVVRQLITELRRHYSLVVLDVGSALDDARAVGIELADDVFLIVGCDIVSIRAARRSIDGWERLTVRGREATHLAVNRVTRGKEIQPDMVAQLIMAPLAVAVSDSPDDTETAVNTGTFVSDCPPRLLEGAGRMLAACNIAAPDETSGPARRARHDPKGKAAKTKIAARAVAGDKGQSAIELPAFVFLFLVAFFVCVQGVVLGASYLVAGNAANDAARQASIGASMTQIREVTQDAMLGFDFDSAVSVDRLEHTVKVVVTIPKVFGWLPDGLTEATAQVGYVPEQAS